MTATLVYAQTSYFTATLSNVPPGYSVMNGNYPAWCANPNIFHAAFDTYRLYDSLGTLPPDVSFPNWHSVNWLLNHKPALSTLPGNSQQVQTEVVQQVIWKLLSGSYFTGGNYPLYDGVHEPGPDLVDPLYNQALANSGFVPQPGQIIAVVLDPTDGAQNSQPVLIEVKVPSRCSSQTEISSNFNGTSIPAGTYIWFNSHIKVSGATQGTTIYFHNQNIKFTANQAYDLFVPDGQITFSSSVNCATMSFDTGTNSWKTVVPLAGSDEIFISGLAFPVPSNFPHVTGNVDWEGVMSTSTPGLNINWQWGAAVYSQFTTNYGSIQVQPTHGNSCSGNNSDHAGTPENFKPYVIGGARGGGGSNFTGSWSGTVSVTPQCTF
ncbi:MAG: hypothetical protein ACR2I2_07695 [Bryobacteraceae bacterium]